jgi:hypothetical protein
MKLRIFLTLLLVFSLSCGIKSGGKKTIPSADNTDNTNQTDNDTDNDTDEDSSQDNQPNIAELVSFNATFGDDGSNQNRLIITLPEDTTGYQNITLVRALGTTFPECSSENVVTIVSNFSTNPFVVNDSSLDPDTNYSYRACVKGAENTVLSSLTATHRTLSPLVRFTADEGTAPETSILLSVELPASTQGYHAVQVFRDVGNTPPLCGDGDLVVTFNDFSQPNLTHEDSALLDGTEYSYRACVAVEENTFVYNLTTSHTTIGACLVGETLVSTPSGDLLLKDLKIGQELYAYNVKEQEIYVAKILEFKAYGMRKTSTLQFGAHSLSAVANHKIFNTLTNDFQPLQNFNPKNEKFNDFNFGFLFLDSNVNILNQKNFSLFYQESGYQEVYDIKVEGDNNFFANGLLVQGL